MQGQHLSASGKNMLKGSDNFVNSAGFTSHTAWWHSGLCFPNTQLPSPQFPGSCVSGCSEADSAAFRNPDQVRFCSEGTAKLGILLGFKNRAPKYPAVSGFKQFCLSPSAETY